MQPGMALHLTLFADPAGVHRIKDRLGRKNCKTMAKAKINDKAARTYPDGLFIKAFAFIRRDIQSPQTDIAAPLNH